MLLDLYYFKYIYFWVCTKMHKFRKSIPSILQSFKINTSIMKVCFKYTSESEDK